MATGSFTYNALCTKTLKERIKKQRKIVSHSNSTRAMLLVLERLPLNHIFPVGLVRFAGYSSKMYIRHLFSYGGLKTMMRTHTTPISNKKRAIFLRRKV